VIRARRRRQRTPAFFEHIDRRESHNSFGAGGAAKVFDAWFGSFDLPRRQAHLSLLKGRWLMATATTRKESKPKTQPVHKIRVGSTVATIWQNESENGRAFYNTNVVRSYKNDQDEYVDTHSYLESQLLELAKAADLAHTWIVARQSEERADNQG
jgi:hypothetical protein